MKKKNDTDKTELTRIISVLSFDSKIESSEILKRIIKIKDNTTHSHIQLSDEVIHKNNVFHFFYDNKLTNSELLYAIRTSDIIICLITKNFDESNLSIYKKHFPTCIVCYIEEEDKTTARKLAKTHFGDCKSINLKNILDYLRIVKFKNTKLCDRPYFIGTQYNYSNDHIFVKGYAKRSFLTKKVILNGLFKLELESVCDLCGNQIECDYEDTIDIEEFKDKITINGDLDYQKTEDYNNQNKHSGEDVYEDKDNYDQCPDYYQNICFLKNFNVTEKNILKMESKGDDYMDIIITFKKPTFSINTQFMCFFNEYPLEDIYTIYNMNFTTEKPLINNKVIIIDIGHCLYQIKPVLSTGDGTKGAHVSESLRDGIISFIAPLSFNITRALLFEKTNEDLCFGDFLGIATNNRFYDRILLEEKILKGYPHKMDKRYCVANRMFKSKQEVCYYLNSKLITQDKNEGFIKKPIGTHGNFKAYFDKPLKSGSVIKLVLHERVYPAPI